jgi:hypothetical protein
MTTARLYYRTAVKNIYEYTVKLGYNDQLGTGRICLLKPGFVITGLLF